MPLVSVWKCPKTGKLFENRSKYFKHLRALGIERRIKRQKDVYRNEWDLKIQELNMLTTEQDIIEWVESNSKLLLMNELNRNTFRTHVPKNINNFHIKILGINLRYDFAIACTHSAPRGHKTNWHGTTDSPSHFPGWRGHLRYGVSDWTSGVGSSDIWTGTGIRTCGGGSWTDFSHNDTAYKGFQYDLILWEADWPGLKIHRALTLEE